ncbi:hypothetical protein ACWD4G_07905 [Streptomyces sp. NPDC002643]
MSERPGRRRTLRVRGIGPGFGGVGRRCAGETQLGRVGLGGLDGRQDRLVPLGRDTLLPERDTLTVECLLRNPFGLCDGRRSVGHCGVGLLQLGPLDTDDLLQMGDERQCELRVRVAQLTLLIRVRDRSAAPSRDLAPDDRAAVADLLAAQRGQAVADVLRRQRTDAVAAELADPAALLLRWIERDGSDWSRLSAVVADAEKVAEVFARHRPAHERTVDHEALEVLREFLGSFPDPSQKLMLYTLLAAGMDHAKRPQHAAKTLSLLNGHAQLGETGGG